MNSIGIIIAVFILIVIAGINVSAIKVCTDKIRVDAENKGLTIQNISLDFFHIAPPGRLYFNVEYQDKNGTFQGTTCGTTSSASDGVERNVEGRIHFW